ncbi:MAG: cupin domain-containing protein [Lapillicoccus sp.]
MSLPPPSRPSRSDAYPPPLYTGGSGEVSATLRRDDSPPDLSYPNGGRVQYLSTCGSTGGLFGLYRWEFGPGVSGPDPHFHRSLTESFYILDGEVEIHDGSGWVTTHPGDYVHVPAGGIHGFKHRAEGPASMLLHFAPGAPREAYFEGLARLAAGETMTDTERDAFMQHHDNHWVE